MNHTQSTPVITDMKVIPVAGYDSMLLNIGGAHGAYFTRNIVILTDSSGNTGVGDALGGEVIYQTLVDAIPQVKGQQIARMNKRGARNDAAAMQYLIPNWKFDRKRPMFWSLITDY